MSLESRVRARLAELGAAGMLRRLRPPEGIDFSSNDYLGLSDHPRIKQRMAEAVLEEGCGSTGSRLLRGQRACFSSAERAFARFKGVEASLYFAAGYMANLAVLDTFAGQDDVIYSDERNHASLIDGCRLSRAGRVVFPHNNPERLAHLLRMPCQGQRFVVTESLFSMDGDLAPVGEYAALCRAFGAALIVDEAHAVGVYGDRGSGLIEAAGVGEDVFLSINTAGKALGVSGAFVAGPQWAIDYLVQRARPFVFSTAPPPAVGAAIETSIELIAAEPERRHLLLSRASHLRRALSRAGVAVSGGESQIIPVLIGGNNEAVAVAEALQRSGFDVRAIRPPTVPHATARLRLSVNVNLDEEILDRFATLLAGALKEHAPCRAASS